MTFSCACGMRFEGLSEVMLLELVNRHGGHAKESRVEPATAGYEEGWKAGYVKGMDAGVGVGYSDAKARVFLAIDALEQELTRPGTVHLGTKEIVRRMDAAVKGLVGGRP